MEQLSLLSIDRLIWLRWEVTSSIVIFVKLWRRFS